MRRGEEWGREAMGGVDLVVSRPPPKCWGGITGQGEAGERRQRGGKTGQGMMGCRAVHAQEWIGMVASPAAKSYSSS